MRGGLAGASFRFGLLVVLTNPKSALVWAAVATFLFAAGLTTWQVAVFGPVAAVSALVVYGVLFSTVRVGAAFGVAFGTVGAKLVLDGVREIRA